MPIRSRILLNHDICFLPTPRRPASFPSMIDYRSIYFSPLIMCSKYVTFRRLMVVRSNSFVIVPVQGIFSILCRTHISKALSRLSVLIFSVQYSTPYSSTYQSCLLQLFRVNRIIIDLTQNLTKICCRDCQVYSWIYNVIFRETHKC